VIKVRPPLASPSAEDIEAATEFLFPMAPGPGDPGFRIWTDHERAEINRVAWEIMTKRLRSTNTTH